MSLALTARRALILLAALTTTLTACSSGRTQNQPPPAPTITFQTPTADSYLHGVVAISVTATGAARISTFTFDAPAALTATVPSLDPANRAATLSANLDLSSFPDGSLKITVTAHDELGGVTTEDLLVNVAARAPTVAIASPSASSIVKGSAVAVTATASAQTGTTITKLELLSPPTGMGSNTSAAAALFAATWDTTATLEGSVTLHFRATDSTGLTGDSSITVTVDNVPLGKLDTYVFAGAPVRDAHIQVWALSNETGAVDTSAGANGLLGTAGPTDASGHVLLTLTAENYSGPIQLRALPAPGASLQYVDPSDPGSGFVQIPSNLQLSSIIASYTTGQAITTPITLTTTLADAELLAYAAGNHRLHSTPRTVTAAAAYGDGLFTQHLQASTPRWTLRSTIPVDLTNGPATLTDRAYAAFGDVALNQLAKDLGAQVHVSGVITAPFLLSKLTSDLAGDGQLDGKAAGGAAVTTETGSPPYSFDENTLRVRLANALDTWVQSPRNQSTLGRSTLDGAGVYQQISNDTSELFGPAPTTPFDNVAPQVTAALTYGPTSAAPYLGSYVSGSLTLILTATDVSGVKSLSVKLGNQLLDSAASTVSSNNGQQLTYTATVDTRTFTDLTYLLTVTATDQRNNTATTTAASVTVDNTAPAIALSQPVLTTHYSSAVPIDATASDGVGAGVQSLTLSGFTGLTDLDSATTHYLGTWTIPAGVTSGVTEGAWSTCDYVGNCASPALPVTVDRLAPVVTYTGPSPVTTNATTIDLTVTATDPGSGVKGVFAQGAGGQLITGTLAAGTWTLANIPVNQGSNTVLVWGTDNASPNNGSTLTAITVPVLSDTAAPSATLASTPSYYDERGLIIATDAAGRAVVPAQYSFTPSTSTKLAIPLNGHIYKAPSRLGWTSAPTAAVLEGANPDNIPMVQFAVPFNAAVEAPITSASWTVNVTCPGCSYPAATGSLLLSPASGGGQNLYDLALSSNNIPALATLPTTAQLSVTLTLTDAAGNTSTTPSFNFQFHLVGAPVALVEDSSYPASADPRSTYPYARTSAAYPALFDPITTLFLPDNQVRLLHYFITNPAPLPVAISASAFTNASWTVQETWTGTSTAAGTKTYGPSCSGTPAGTCPTTQIEYLLSGSGAAACGTQPPHNVTPLPDSPIVSSASTYALRAFNHSGGVDGAAATLTPSGAYIVPAASGGQPGVLSVYVTRPIGATRSYAMGTFSGSTFSYVVELAWKYASTTTVVDGSCGPGVPKSTAVWSGTTWSRALSSSTETIGFTFSLSSLSLNGTATIGDSTPITTVTVSNRTVAH